MTRREGRPRVDRRPRLPWFRLATAILAGATLASTFASPAFRTPDQALSGLFVVPFALALTLFAIAFWGTPRRLTAVLWAGLSVIGHAILLQLISAGPNVGYPHMITLDQFFDGAHRPWSVFMIAATCVVGFGFRPLAGPVWSWFRRNVGPWRGLAAFTLLCLASAALSREPSRYAIELVLTSVVQLVFLCAFALAVRALPEEDVEAIGRTADRLLGPVDTPETHGFWRLDRFAWTAAAVAITLTVLLTVLSYQRHPHVPDDVVYLLHARYFAHGMLTMPLPPVPEAFDIDLMTYEATRWYSPVPPGWPAVLAVGAYFGVPWLVNPVLSGIAVLFAYVLLRDLYGTRSARVGVALLCASPWFLFMGMSLMTHQLTLVAALAAATCVARFRRAGGHWWSIPAGIGLGVVALGRPLEGFTLAVLLALWMMNRSDLRRRLTGVAIMAVAAMATASITLPYNQYLTGSMTRFPIMAYTDATYGVNSNALGFGADRGLGWSGLDPYPGHGLRDVLVNANLNISQVNVELFGWATGSIFLILLLFAMRGTRRPDAWMLAVVGSIVGMHSLYWFSGGPDFGARYWYLILIPCIALSMGGLRRVSDSLERAGDRMRPGIAVTLLCASTLLVFVPWRAADKYYNYRGMRPDIRRLAHDHEFGRSLVLVRGERHPDYASAAAYNPIDLNADAPIYAWDRSDEVRSKLLEAYRDRVVWIVDGPTITGAGFRIVAGPVPAADLISGVSGGR